MAELEEADDEEVKGEIIQNSLIAFVDYMASNPILQQNGTGKVLGDDGCKQYLGQVKETIKDQTSQLPVWNKHEELWYSRLRESLGAGKKRDLITGNWEFKDPTSRALPIRATESALRQCERMWKEVQGVDLESISFSIIATGESHCYRERSKLVVTALATARGGEVTFARYDLTWWDDIFLSLEMLWSRLKTAMQQSLYFQTDADGYLCDFYHCMGCYFSVEDGLFRPESMNPRISRAVFPDLKNVSSESVATQMTKLIRKHSDPALKERNQSRSIRVGSNTALAMHPDVTPEEQRNAGGFKSGYNTDLYTRMNPKLGMTAANALAGHKNARKMVYPPSLGSLVGLVDGDGLNLLESKLYLVSVAQFKPGGPLQPFLQTCTAKLIMEHPSMVRDFGRNNKMVKKLVESMVKAKLASNPAEASQKLDHWSTVIQKDYQTKNSLLPSATDATVLDVVQQQSVLINTLVLSHRNLEIQLEKLTGELAGVREDVNSQSTSIVTALSTSLKGAVQGVFGRKDSHNNDMATAVHKQTTVESAESIDDPATTTSETPLSSPAQPSPSVHAQASAEMLPSPDEPEVMTAFIESMQGMLQDAQKKGEKDKLVALSWTPLQGSSVKGVTVKDTLLQLVQERRLYTKKKLYEVEPSSLDPKNRGHYWSCMELVDSVITNEQNRVLQMNKKEQEKIDDYDDILKITAYNIEKAAFDRMKDLDSKKTSSTRPTITGLGNRYTQYCDTNGIERIMSSHKNTAAAPTAGSRSIKDWFGQAKAKVVNALSPGREKHSR
jgi:hypothetical protein